MADSTVADRGAHSKKRRRLAPFAWIGSIVAVVVLALGVTGSLSGFTASITNQANQAGTGQAPILTETGPDLNGTPTTCASTSGTGGAYTCTTINKYGNGGQANLALVPGGSASTTVTFTNSSTTSASTFILAAGVCTQGTQAPANGGGNLCTDGTFTVTVACVNGAPVPVAVLSEGPVSPAALNTATTTTPLPLTGGLAAAATDTCTITTALASGATNAEAGLTATQDLTWTIST